MRVLMTILRDGYWDGQYPRAGDTIEVEPGLVEQLEMAGFAIRQAETAAAGPARSASPPPGRKAHGR